MFTGPRNDYMYFYSDYNQVMESRGASNWSQAEGPLQSQEIGAQIAEKIYKLVPDFENSQANYVNWGKGYVTTGYVSDEGALRLSVYGAKDAFRLEFLAGSPSDDFLIHATRIDRVKNTVYHLHVDKDRKLSQYTEPYVFKK